MHLSSSWVIYRGKPKKDKYHIKSCDCAGSEQNIYLDSGREILYLLIYFSMYNLYVVTS
jgi:hypothetical protein